MFTLCSFNVLSLKKSQIIKLIQNLIHHRYTRTYYNKQCFQYYTTFQNSVLEH